MRTLYIPRLILEPQTLEMSSRTTLVLQYRDHVSHDSPPLSSEVTCCVPDCSLFVHVSSEGFNACGPCTSSIFISSVAASAGGFAPEHPSHEYCTVHEDPLDFISTELKSSHHFCLSYVKKTDEG